MEVLGVRDRGTEVGPGHRRPSQRTGLGEDEQPHRVIGADPLATRPPLLHPTPHDQRTAGEHRHEREGQRRQAPVAGEVPAVGRAEPRHGGEGRQERRRRTCRPWKKRVVRGASLGGEPGVELTRLVEPPELGVAADRRSVDQDLRHGPAAR